jgi:biotin/methionine sulfoxide reductase
MRGQFWTAQAKLADIVLPATTTLERDDIGSAAGERFLVVMKQVVATVGETRDDHAIRAGIAERLGLTDAFSEGRDTMGWLAHLYDASQSARRRSVTSCRRSEQFWREGMVVIPHPTRRS